MPRTAAEAYAEALARVAQSSARLQSVIKSHQVNAAKYCNWGMVGDMGRLANVLNEEADLIGDEGSCYPEWRDE